jgi:hypothetical protein
MIEQLIKSYLEDATNETWIVRCNSQQRTREIVCQQGGNRFDAFYTIWQFSKSDVVDFNRLQTFVEDVLERWNDYIENPEFVLK